MTDEKTKVCKYCGRELPLTNEYFAWANKAKGKYQDRCKECFSQYMHNRWLDIKAEDGERLKKANEAKQKYVETRIDRVRENRRRYDRNHADEVRERSRIKNGRKYWGDEEFARRTGWTPSGSEQKEYSVPIREDRLEQKKKYREARREELLEKHRQYNEENKDKILEKHRQYNEENKDKIAAYTKKRYWSRREELLEKQRQYRKTDKYRERARNYSKQYCKDRYHNDQQYKNMLRVRNFLNNSFRRRGEIKSKRNIELTGMTSRELYDYLLGTFKDIYGYDWDFQERVHIDHIVPLSSAKDYAEIEKLCHYTNLRLIKAKDNLQKGAKLDYELTTPQERM